MSDEMTKITKKEAIARMCALVWDVHTKLCEGKYFGPCDCFCGNVPNNSEHYQNDGLAIEWIEQVVQKALDDL